MFGFSKKKKQEEPKLVPVNNEVYYQYVNDRIKQIQYAISAQREVLKYNYIKQKSEEYDEVMRRYITEVPDQFNSYGMSSDVFKALCAKYIKDINEDNQRLANEILGEIEDCIYFGYDCVLTVYDGLFGLFLNNEKRFGLVSNNKEQLDSYVSEFVYDMRKQGLVYEDDEYNEYITNRTKREECAK